MADRTAEGRVFWITGLSGAGKTVVSRRLALHLADAGLAPLLLDGDGLREIFGGGFGHDPEERRGLSFYCPASSPLRRNGGVEERRISGSS